MNLKPSNSIRPSPFAQQKAPSASQLSTLNSQLLKAFTMIEIAISLAVIGFALVAIVGVLPLGMNVQRENREETIINQDATMFMNAIRNGAAGQDDLTNYVVAISNYVAQFDFSTRPPTRVSAPQWQWYTRTASGPIIPDYPLTNGLRIISLLSTPRFTPVPGNTNVYYSNFVVAIVRSMSGPASEKAPQDNADVRELALNYRMIADISPIIPYDPWDGGIPATNDVDFLSYSNHWAFARNVQSNMHNVRLTFRWPLLPNAKIGNGRQTYRTSVSGHLAAVQDPWHPSGLITNYFFEPRNYVKAPLP